MTGNRGELLGWIYAAPGATLFITGDGRIDHGAGKFVAQPSSQILIGCPSADKQIDFVAIKVSEIEWGAFGEPKRIVLKTPKISYHLRDHKEEFPEVSLQKGSFGDFIQLAKKTDAVFLNELAGKTKPTPNALASFAFSANGSTVNKNMGLYLRFTKCTNSE